MRPPPQQTWPGRYSCEKRHIAHSHMCTPYVASYICAVYQRYTKHRACVRLPASACPDSKSPNTDSPFGSKVALAAAAVVAATVFERGKKGGGGG